MLLTTHGLHGFLQAIVDLVNRDPPLTAPTLAAALTPEGAAAGRSWALEAWANVLLPLVAGFAQAQGQAVLAERAGEHYATVPGGGDNQVLTRMLAITGLPALPRLAIDQQGLLEIWSRRCSTQSCETCPLAAAG
jgi:hypothetical protein